MASSTTTSSVMKGMSRENIARIHFLSNIILAQARATEGQKYYYGVTEKTNKNEKGEEVKKKIQLAFHIMFQVNEDGHWAHLTKEVKVTEEEHYEHAVSHSVEQGAVFWLRSSHKDGFLEALELLFNDLLAVVNPSKGIKDEAK